MILKILYEFLNNNLDLEKFTVVRDFNTSRQNRKLAIEVPHEITIDNVNQAYTMNLRSSANQDVTCEIDELVKVLNYLNSYIIPYVYNDELYYLNFSYDSITATGLDDQKNNLYQINYIFSATKK